MLSSQERGIFKCMLYSYIAILSQFIKSTVKNISLCMQNGIFSSESSLEYRSVNFSFDCDAIVVNVGLLYV